MPAVRSAPAQYRPAAPKPVTARPNEGALPSTGLRGYPTGAPAQESPLAAQPAAPVFQEPSLAALGAPAPAPPPAAMPDFNNEQFMKGLDASRGNINQMLQNVLGELNRQNTAAQGQVSQIPAALAGIFDPQRQNFLSGIDTMNQAVQGAGLQGLDVAGINAPILAALGQQQGIFGAAAPLLSAGFNELLARQTGGANQLGQQLLADVDTQGREYVAGRESEERGYGFQGGQAAADRAFRMSEGDKDRSFQGGQAAADRSFRASEGGKDRAATAPRRDPVADATAEYSAKLGIDKSLGINDFAPPKPKEDEYKLSDFGAHEFNPLRGKSLVAEDPATVSKIRADKRWPADKKKVQEIIKQHGADPAMVVSEVQAYFGKRDRTGSLALWDLGYRPA